MQVKDNQEQLRKDCEYNLCSRQIFDNYVEPEIKARGRIEKRIIEVCDNNKVEFSISDREFKPHIKQIIRVTRHREILDTKSKKYKKSLEISLYISDIPLKAKDYANIIRGHWLIENLNHHVKDERFSEDKSRIRKKAFNIAVIRSFSLNLLRANEVDNISIELFRNL